MIKNYLIIAFRNLNKHRLYSAINVLGLALGICFSLLIALYVFSERSVNRDLRHANRHFLLKSNWKVANLGLEITSLAPLPAALHQQYPSLVAGSYSYNPVTNVISANHRFFKQDISIGDTSLIALYGFELLHGDPRKAFRDNSSAVITEELAVRLFGKTDVIGERISVQTLVRDQQQDYFVSAVLKNLPRNTVTGLLGDHYGLFIPFGGSRYYASGDPSQSWQNAFHVCFIELQPGVQPADLDEPLRKLIDANAPAGLRENINVELAPVHDYYLKANNGAVEKMIFTLSLAGLFILAMALINFINLSVGSSFGRLKEIGLRKVLGGRKAQLILQFLFESLLVTMLAAILAIAAFVVLRPVFNELLTTSIPSLTDIQPLHWMMIVGSVVVVGLLAGIYPAVVLSASGIAVAVRGKFKNTQSGIWIRKTLLVVQFTLTIVVFLGSVAVSRQVNHIFHKDLGYNRDQLMVVTAFPKQWDSAGVKKITAIKQQLQQLPVVRSASVAFEVPERKPPATVPLLPVDGRSTQPINVMSISADEDYADTYELKVVSGSFFNKGVGPVVPGQIVLNESAVRALGIDPARAIGQLVHFPAGQGNPVTVVGVVKDYNYSAIDEGVEPMSFIHVNDFLNYRYLTIRLKAGNMNDAIAQVEAGWKKASPNSPFEYFFMDEKFASLYRSELQLKKASGLATILNLAIVLMGVLGVVTFTLARRNKEIAVRKVLGASAGKIISLFIREYGIAILIANLIAWPLAYWMIGKWLENYQYRIQQEWWMFAGVAVLVMTLAFGLIAAQCFRTAIANPAKTLRTE